MKKEIIRPPKRLNTQQAILNFLMVNGMSPSGAEKFIHINIPALGSFKSVQDCIDNGEWDEAWGAVESYMVGDYY